MVKLQRRKISKRTVDSLSVEGKEVVFWDQEFQGFGVRVYPSGAKVYIAQSRAGGKSRRITLGRHGVITPDQARRKAALAIARIKEGESPKLTPSELAADPAPTRHGQSGRDGTANALHRQVLSAIVGRYDRYLMNDAHRAEYVQCLVAELLGPQWTPPWTRGHDRAAWDLEHVSGARMEIEQTAALLARHGAKSVRNQLPRVGIAPRKGYWTADGRAIGRRTVRGSARRAALLTSTFLPGMAKKGSRPWITRRPSSGAFSWSRPRACRQGGTVSVSKTSKCCQSTSDTKRSRQPCRKPSLACDGAGIGPSRAPTAQRLWHRIRRRHPNRNDRRIGLAAPAPCHGAEPRCRYPVDGTAAAAAIRSLIGHLVVNPDSKRPEPRLTPHNVLCHVHERAGRKQPDSISRRGLSGLVGPGRCGAGNGLATFRL